VDPGQIPRCYLADAYHNTNSVHGIPHHGFQLAEKNYRFGTAPACLCARARASACVRACRSVADDVVLCACTTAHRHLYNEMTNFISQFLTASTPFVSIYAKGAATKNACFSWLSQKAGPSRCPSSL
jgi:hypothetical protein